MNAQKPPAMTTAASASPSGAARDKVVADSVYCEANTTSNYVTILAIFDEPTPVVSQVTPSSSSSASSPSSSTAHVVEVTNLSAPPQGGLRVDPPAKAAVAPTPAMSSSTSSSSSSQRKYVRNQNGRKSTDSSVPSRSVTLSPEIEKREMSHSKDADSSSTIKRTDARKSRISEGFFDRFEELAVSAPHPSPSAKPRSSLSGLIQSAANPNQTVVVLNKVGSSKEIGIEISAVPHPTNSDRLQAVEILRIDPEGRVAEDGRLKVGDHLVEINERPIYQMSLARVRAYLHELAAITAPTVTVDRPMESFALQDKPDKPVEIKPITSALQQANTKQIGATSTVTIVKGSTNLGFTITSRETAGSDGNMERLFYVGSVKTDGPAFGNLKRGDRLLEVAGQNIAGLNQPDVVALLKAIPQGDGIDLLISRIGSSSDDSAVPTSTSTPVAVMCTSQTAPNLSTPKPTEEFRLPPSPIRRTPSEDNPRTLEFEIPVNDTGSAGLGISLKARATIRPDKSRIDRGIFVKNILTGGAAYKDGRLTISDQIVGIEDVDLTQLKNAQANEAITECLKRLGPNAKTVTLRVRREPLVPVNPNTSSLEISDCTAASISVASTSFLPSPQPAPVASRQNSAFADDAQSEVSSLAGDHFARDNVTRRSVSEKRHIGAANDPSHIQIFQKIKHQRQTSAPPGSMQTSASFTGGIGNSSAKRGESSSANRRHSRSFNAASRARNSSVGLLALASTPEVSVDPVAVEKPVVEFADIPDEEPTGSMRKRSASAESISIKKPSDTQGVHEMVGNGAPFVKHRDASKEPPGSVARRMAKEKQQRRKSIGSTFFSKKWFSLGSKSRDTSPEKPSTSSKHNGEPRKSPDNFVARAKKAMSPPINRHTIFVEHSRVPSDYRNHQEYPRNEPSLGPPPLPDLPPPQMGRNGYGYSSGLPPPGPHSAPYVYYHNGATYRPGPLPHYSPSLLKRSGGSVIPGPPPAPPSYVYPTSIPAPVATSSSDYYDAFNAWFAFSGHANGAPTQSPRHERYRSCPPHEQQPQPTPPQPRARHCNGTPTFSTPRRTFYDPISTSTPMGQSPGGAPSYAYGAPSGVAAAEHGYFLRNGAPVHFSRF